MALRNQPYIPLYVNDFLSDEKLAECSAESTGVYIRLMCLMHKSEEYGVILLKQNAGTCHDFAMKVVKHMPYALEVIERSLNELINNGVLQVNGAKLLQKRMVKDNRVSEVRSVSGRKGGFAKANSIAKSVANTEIENEIESEIESDPITPKEEGAGRRFVPPTIEEVTAYCNERNKGVNPSRWWDFYAGKGWMVGKNKMKDWKAAVRTWEHDDTPSQPPPPPERKSEFGRLV